MQNIDRYAYSSKLYKTDPMQKLVFSITTLVVCLWADLFSISISILSIMTWYTIVKGGTPFRLYLKLLLIPMAFLIMSLLTVALNISNENESFMYSINIVNTSIGVTNLSLLKAARIFFRSLGAVSCLYYLSLSTPVVDLLAALRKLRIPGLFIELMGLIYRFIFILLETADIIFTAQSSRMGYSAVSSGYRSLGAMVASLFIRSYKKADLMYTALEARGYNGEIKVLDKIYDKNKSGYFIILIINILLIGVSILIKSYVGGYYQ